jgi:hypothetical protein
MGRDPRQIPAPAWVRVERVAGARAAAWRFVCDRCGTAVEVHDTFRLHPFAAIEAEVERHRSCGPRGA